MKMRIIFPILILLLSSLCLSSEVNIHCDTSESNIHSDAPLDTATCYSVNSRLEGNFLWQPLLDAAAVPIVKNVEGQSYDVILQEVKTLNTDARLPTIKELSSIVQYSSNSPFSHYQRIVDWLAHADSNGVVLSSTYQSNDNGTSLNGWLGIEISTGKTVLVDVTLNTRKLYALSVRTLNAGFTPKGFRVKNVSDNKCLDKDLGSSIVQAHGTCRPKTTTIGTWAQAQTWYYNANTGQLYNQHGAECAYITAANKLSVETCSSSSAQKWDYLNRGFFAREDHSKAWKSAGHIQIVDSALLALNERSWRLYYP